MSDPVRDLKRELLAAAERQQGHAVPARKSHRRWFEPSDVRWGGRRRRVFALVAALLVVAVGTASAIGSVREFILDQGFVGLSPVGATPSTPESGELVLQWFGRSATLPELPGPDGPCSVLPCGGRPIVRAWVYADGRIIWSRTESSIPEGANEITSGYLEQRLTPEGVELLRSEVVGLLDRSRAVLETVPADDDPQPGPFHGSALFVPRDSGFAGVRFGVVEVRDGDRLVRLRWVVIHAEEGSERFQEILDDARKDFEGTIATPEQVSALRRVDALVTDPASVLPSSAWAVRKIRAYVPTHYAVCIYTSPAKDPSQLLSLLPARAADVLRDKSRTRFEGDIVVNSDSGPLGVGDRWVEYCSKLATEEARQVAEGLSGLDPDPDQGTRLEYRLARGADLWETTSIWFEPYFPHGQITCSACG